MLLSFSIEYNDVWVCLCACVIFSAQGLAFQLTDDVLDFVHGDMHRHLLNLFVPVMYLYVCFSNMAFPCSST